MSSNKETDQYYK